MPIIKKIKYPASVLLKKVSPACSICSIFSWIFPITAPKILVMGNHRNTLMYRAIQCFRAWVPARLITSVFFPKKYMCPGYHSAFVLLVAADKKLL